MEDFHSEEIFVSVPPHASGSPITANEKACILNFCRSLVDDGKSCDDARWETATQLKFTKESVRYIIQEKIGTCMRRVFTLITCKKK